MAKYDYIIYTDGSCHGNPGVGGYAAIALECSKNGETTREMTFSGGDYYTTNNKMELTAVVRALQGVVKYRPCDRKLKVLIRTDSKYIVNQINRGNLETYIKPQNRKNRDLWADLLISTIFFDLEAEWVKGHNGDPINERCDRLANKEAYQIKREENERLRILSKILLDGPTIDYTRLAMICGTTCEIAKKYADLYVYHRFKEEN